MRTGKYLVTAMWLSATRASSISRWPTGFGCVASVMDAFAALIPSGGTARATTPRVRTVVVPVGGGLAAGVAVRVKEFDATINVVGVQAEAVAPYPGPLAAGHPVSVRAEPTMADGIAISRPGDLPLAILSGLTRATFVPGSDRGSLTC